MANVYKQFDNKILFTEEDRQLFEEFPKQVVAYMADHIGEVTAGNIKEFVAGAVDSILPVKGKQVLEDCVQDEL